MLSCAKEGEPWGGAASLNVRFKSRKCVPLAKVSHIPGKKVMFLISKVFI